MLISAAEHAGMKTPILDKNDQFNREEFPHFAVFCNAQLCRPMHSLNEHWENAKVIAEISDNEIRSVSIENLIGRGFSWAS